MDCTVSGLNSFDTERSDTGLSFAKLELATEKEEENHGFHQLVPSDFSFLIRLYFGCHFFYITGAFKIINVDNPFVDSNL